MRFNRKKTIRRVLRWYNTCFGFYSPYHCLIDLSFIEHSLQNRLNIRDQLETIFEKVTPCVTSCLLDWLKSQGNRMIGPFKVASQYYRLQCACASPTAASVQRCIRQKLSEKTFVLCSCESSLKSYARRAVGLAQGRPTPLVTIQGQVPVLEGPSDETKRFVALRDAKTQTVQPWEAQNTKTQEQIIAQALQTEPAEKKKKKTHPNPLSVKKKITTSDVVDEAPKKTRRSRRSNKANDLSLAI